MKIIREDSTFLLPQDDIIVLTGKCKNNIIDCFTNYFDKKKRNYCKVFDSNGEQLDNKDLKFIYYPYHSNVDSNYSFNEKSIFNTEFTNIITENPLDFSSFEKIREGLHDCITDCGMYKLHKILTRNMNLNLDITLSDFNINQLISMLKIDIEKLNESQKYQIVYNLLIYLNRGDYNVVYLDFPMTDETIDWIQSYNRDNLIFILDNTSIHCDVTKDMKNVSMVIASNQDYMETYGFDIHEFNDISYIQNPFIMLHKEQQTEKNIRLMQQFEDENTTFYLKFSDTYAQNTL